ncbi:MAG TPA: ABC transporter ATP-binding protein [Polyangiaceae bacterium]
MAAAVSLPPLSPEPPEPLIELSHVSKDYETGGGVVHAMRDVDLVIARGEFVAIVGTSGSGKSTMMNILGCLDRPTQGSYMLAGIDVGIRAGDSRAIVRNRVIGFIFQGFNLLPRTTALENCELPLQYRGVGGRARRKRAEAVLDSVGLGDRMDHKPNQLSGGQQQRVAIARALVTDPPLLLADEPTGNLDTRTSLEVLALLQRLNRDRGITIVLVTHERDIAACASRVVTMRDGRIVTDVVQDEPMDAAAELAQLAKPEAGSSELVSATDPARLEASRSRAPVPKLTYGAAWVGSRLGVLFAKIVFGIAAVARPDAVGFFIAASLFGLLCESWRAARSARRRLGYPLTNDQRVRLALWYTLITGSLVTALVVLLTFAAPSALAGLSAWSLFATLSLRLSGRGAAVIVAGGVIFHGALVLLRYLLLTLFNPRR